MIYLHNRLNKLDQKRTTKADKIIEHPLEIDAADDGIILIEPKNIETPQDQLLKAAIGFILAALKAGYNPEQMPTKLAIPMETKIDQ